ncbi:unnamed protein product [Urochloa humidicola]
MGNGALRRDRLDDEENAVAIAIAEAAAMGAWTGLIQKVEAAAAAAAAQEGPGAAGGAAAAHHISIGLLPLPDAVTAAAEGACNGIRGVVRLLAPAARRLASASDLLQVQAGAAAGAAGGVRSAAVNAARNPPVGVGPLAANQQAIAGQMLDRDMVAGYAARAAWSGCYDEVRRLPVRSSANQWGTRLPPILGALLVLSGSSYSHLTSVSDWIVLGLYGGLLLVIVTLMVRVLAVPFTKSMTSESMSRNSAFTSFIIIVVLLTVVWCTMFSAQGFIIFSGIAGALVVLGFVYLWFLSFRHQ